MKFEEKFPSLKEKIFLPYYTREYEVVKRKDIEKNCLDKQRVKEVLIKNVIKGEGHYTMVRMLNIYEELGI